MKDMDDINSEEDFAKKEQEIKSDMSEQFIQTLYDSFIDDYENQKSKMDAINEFLATQKSPKYEYDEFCRNVLTFSQEALMTKVDYSKFFMTKEEFEDVLEKDPSLKEDEEKRYQALEKIYRLKFLNELYFVVDQYIILSLLEEKMGEEKFKQIEEEVKMSSKISKFLYLSYMKNEEDEK